MDIFSLKGKTAIVTGACGLLGMSHCVALAAAGANVVVADLDESLAENFSKELGVNHVGIKVDVTDENSLLGAKDKVMDSYGKIDILVNNAAINEMVENSSNKIEESRFENYSLRHWKKMIDVNITGTFLASRVFGTAMAQAGKGSIINIASTYGITAPDQRLYQNELGEQTFYKSPAYPTTKGAVLSFTRFLSAYWGKNGVRVNALSPGGVENGQDDFFIKNYGYRTVLGRMADKDDYQGAIVFLASDASSYMTGANLVVDGGWTII